MFRPTITEAATTSFEIIATVELQKKKELLEKKHVYKNSFYVLILLRYANKLQEIQNTIIHLIL